MIWSIRDRFLVLTVLIFLSPYIEMVCHMWITGNLTSLNGSMHINPLVLTCSHEIRSTFGLQPWGLNYLYPKLLSYDSIKTIIFCTFYNSHVKKFQLEDPFSNLFSNHESSFSFSTKYIQQHLILYTDWSPLPQRRGIFTASNSGNGFDPRECGPVPKQDCLRFG